MNVLQISEDDIVRVARSIGKSLTEEQVKEIISEYPAWKKQDPTATWNLIVEDLIYFVILVHSP